MRRTENTLVLVVIPAEAGIHERHKSLAARWIPASAGMTMDTPWLGLQADGNVGSRQRIAVENFSNDLSAKRDVGEISAAGAGKINLASSLPGEWTQAAALQHFTDIYLN